VYHLRDFQDCRGKLAVDDRIVATAIRCFTGESRRSLLNRPIRLRSDGLF
jgi:hypothetical protein